ncbi:MAG: hypothetical protein K1X53_12265 [Candidatus Sumerlaeaceae bacterium]|nr:hypothetical protein [Candidatus Sumerlaeaceae bacterium]
MALRRLSMILVVAAASNCVLRAAPNVDSEGVAGASAVRAKVRADKGSIVFTLGKSEAKLTTSGLDSEPVISPDGAKVAFVRTPKAKPIETAQGEADATEIWMVSVDGTGAVLVVASREHDKPEEILAGFGNLRFSLDGKTLYFTSAAWTTSSALKALDLATGKVRHVGPSNGFEILAKGKHKGQFVNFEHTYGPDGAEDKCWLMSPGGRNIRSVGEDLENAVRRLEKE